MKSKVLLIGIVIIAAFLRLYQLSSIPPHPSLDEVSIGYNAYSILKTGKDEYGTPFPILLRAYDDFRPALYTYLVVPFIKMFGLNIFAVRLPSAILAILTILATYFLVKELLKVNLKSKIPNPKQIQPFDFAPESTQGAQGKNSNSQNLKHSLEIGPPAGGWKLEISLLSAGLLAISPWHIYFSRIGHEWNGALSFFVFGLLFFLKYVNVVNNSWLSLRGMQSRSNLIKIATSPSANAQGPRNDSYLGTINLTAASICFALSFDFYQSAKIFVPIFLLVLFFIFRKELLLGKKTTVLCSMVGLIVIFPILLATFSPNALIRFQGTNVFEAKREVFERSAQRVSEDLKNNDFIGAIFDNRRMLYFLIPAHAYLSHFNYAWLFTNSGEEPFKVPDFGLLYLFELPLMILGVIFLIKTNAIATRIKLLIVIWVLTAILPASITTGYPHAARIYNIAPALHIVGAVGLYFLLSLILQMKNISIKKFSILFLIFSFAFFASWFYYSYFVNFKRELSYQFQYGVIEGLSYADKMQDTYDKIYVSNKENLFQSYMFYLFSSKYDPIEYQKFGGTGSGGFDAEHKIGKFEFGRVNFTQNPNTLYVINPHELPEEKIRILRKVKFLNGKDGVWIVVQR